MTNLVQAIAVTPGTHLQTIAATAIASARAACMADPDDFAWKTWFNQAFTKTVRRASKPSQIRRLAHDPQVASVFQVGLATAHAYAPMTYDQFPKHLRNLQVAGLDVDRSRDYNQHFLRVPATAPQADYIDPLVVINRDVEMSTGKTAAQVAHALVAWTRHLSELGRADWLSQSTLRVLYGDLDLDPEAHTITIRDNGLTEVEPGTATVQIALP